MNQFLQVDVNHVPRFKNDKVDALAKLDTSVRLPDEREIQITIGERHLLALILDCFDETKEINVVSIFKVKEEVDWRQPPIEYIQYSIFPTDPEGRLDVKR